MCSSTYIKADFKVINDLLVHAKYLLFCHILGWDGNGCCCMGCNVNHLLERQLFNYSNWLVHINKMQEIAKGINIPGL